MNIDKDRWLEFDRAWIATGTRQCPSDEKTLQGDGRRHVTLFRMGGLRKEQET